MQGKGKISVFQFFSILFVCRVIAFFTFILTDRSYFSPGDRSVLFVPFVVSGLLISVPALIIIGRKENGTVFDLTENLSPKVTKFISAIYALGAVWSAAVSAARFELFMSTVMFSGAELFGFMFLMLEAALLIAHGGIETMGRMSVIIIAVLGASLTFVAITTVKDFDYTNLSPPLYDGVLPLIKSGFSSVARTSELAAVLIMAPKINGSIKKGLGLWFLSLGVIISALFTLIIGVTGEYGERQMFQLYALTVLSKIGVIERLDALICAIWVLCSLLRTSFYLYTGQQFLEGGFKIKHKTLTLVNMSLLVLAGYRLLSGNVSFFSRVLSSGINETVFAVILVVIPLLLIITERTKRRINRSKGTP